MLVLCSSDSLRGRHCHCDSAVAEAGSNERYWSATIGALYIYIYLYNYIYIYIYMHFFWTRVLFSKIWVYQLAVQNLSNSDIAFYRCRRSAGHQSTKHSLLAKQRMRLKFSDIQRCPVFSSKGIIVLINAGIAAWTESKAGDALEAPLCWKRSCGPSRPCGCFQYMGYVRSSRCINCRQTLYPRYIKVLVVPLATRFKQQSLGGLHSW